MAETKKRKPGRPPGSKNKSTKASQQNEKPKTKQEHIKDIQEQIDREKRTIDVIWSVTLFALGIFFLFTIVRNSTGAFGKAIHDIGLGLFGIMAYVLPFLFLLASILLAFRKLQHINGRTAFFGILIFVMICIINSARFIDESRQGYGFADIVKYYKLGVEEQQGGAVGMEFGSLLVKGFGMPGLYIFAVALLIISIVLVANNPIADFFGNISRKHEEKKLLAELDAAEAAKIQSAVASTATAYADPDTGIVPPVNINSFDSSYYKTPEEVPERGSDRIINGVDKTSELNRIDTIVLDNNAVPDNKTNKSEGGLRGFFKRNTLLGTRNDTQVSDAGKYDSEEVGGYKNSKDHKQGYGLGEVDDIGNSGSYGLDGYDTYDFNNRHSASGQTGLGYSDTLDDECDKPVENNSGNKRKRSSNHSHAEDLPNTAAVAAIAAGSVVKTRKEASPAEIDEVENELSSALNSKDDDSSYQLPPVSLLKKGSGNKQMMSDYQLEEKADLLEHTLKNFNVDAKVIAVTQGASVTRYEVQPATGVKVSSITRLADDIALNLRAKSIRIEAPIPGKAAVGIEVENDKPAPIVIRDLIESKEFTEAKSKLSFVVGKDITGNNIIANLAEMPHLLIAGTTGSGKSVCVNGIIASFLYKAKPSELKMIMVDPKVVELANYNGIPHMLVPVVTDPRKASRALAVAVKEMDDRYELFAKARVKDLKSYNELMRAEQEPQKCKPEIVIVIDELADLMMAAPSEVESSICRLAQKARAAGMHLIIATQRPSVDVVTGIIKANIPSRIALSVSSAIDSRTILDMSGAEKLLGKGDMLFSPVGSNKPLRVQGPYISDSETDKLIKFVKDQGGQAVYDEDIKSAIENTEKMGAAEPEDELTEDAIAFILKSKQASVSMLQRRFRIGYNRSARIIDEIEAKGIIGPSDGSRPRQVLITEDDYYGADDEIVTDEELVLPNEEDNTSVKEAYESLPEAVQREILSSD